MARSAFQVSFRRRLRARLLARSLSRPLALRVPFDVTLFGLFPHSFLQMHRLVHAVARLRQSADFCLRVAHSLRSPLSYRGR